jgi:hypothetical protein
MLIDRHEALCHSSSENPSERWGEDCLRKRLLGKSTQNPLKYPNRCTSYGSFDRSEEAIVRAPFCPAAHAYDWQRLEHHLASIRLGKISAPQLGQISIRLVAVFRSGLRSSIGPSFGMRRIFPLDKPLAFNADNSAPIAS